MKTEELKVFHVRDLHVAGLYQDVHPASDVIPKQGFQACLNTRFRLGRLEVVPGWIAFGTNALDSRVMIGGQYIKQDGTAYLVAISLTKAYVYNTSTGAWDVVASVFTGDEQDFFDMSVGFDTLIVTNGLDRVQKWTGTGGFSDLGGLTDAYPGGINVSQAKIIRSVNGFMVALNTSEDGVEYPQRVRWGKQGFLETWKNDTDGNGQAGYYDLQNTPDSILAAEPTSNGLFIMKERSLYLMQYVGLPIIWYFREISASSRPSNGIGIIGPGAYVAVGSEIILLCQDNFYVFSGVSLQVLGDNRVKTMFFNDLNPTYIDRIQMFYVEEEDEVCCAYPSIVSTGNLDKIVAYNKITKTWSFRETDGLTWFKYIRLSNLTWDTMPDVSWDSTVGSWNDRSLLSQFPLVLFGDSSGQVMEYGGVYSQNGGSYSKTAETKLFDFERPDIKKRVERVEVSVDRSLHGNLTVYVGHCTALGDAITYSSAFTLDMENGRGFFTCDITDIYFDLKFETTGSGDPYRIYEYKIWYKERTQQ